MDFTSIAPLLNTGKKLTPEEISRACRLSISAEEDAVHLYELIAQSVDEKTAKVFSSVAAEEKIHVGEFTRLLNEFDSSNKDLEQKGQQETEDLYKTAVSKAMSAAISGGMDIVKNTVKKPCKCPSDGFNIMQNVMKSPQRIKKP